ncbi:type II secretion system F family protein [Bailinhaonella thermotolerans]|uniref:Pilus assembly protein TadB n=1 Tax=Bailinhaonella thermotolerans TaxID=1070861 RepID=A0A3A4A4L3_9ACTN|nr:type II secretion system F family protein [Bailinhaonella thermotolerans]RJL20409.1 pilus assembly protein TadB [Bailinhaonella thermotolerans]
MVSALAGTVAVLAAALAGWCAVPGTGERRLAALGPGAGGRGRAWEAWRSVPDRWRRRRERRELRARWPGATVELCRALTGELGAGRTPGQAVRLAVAALDDPFPALLREVTAVARDGGDVAEALERAVPGPEGDGLRRLAACFRVSVAAGAGLAPLTERVAASLTEAESHRQEVAAQLAGPRATARLLAVLPSLGLLLGLALGMRPLHFLLGGVPGFLCLLAGVALDALGLSWTNRIVAKAEGAAR